MSIVLADLARPGVTVSIPQVARNDSQTRQYIVIRIAA